MGSPTTLVFLLISLSSLGLEASTVPNGLRGLDGLDLEQVMLAKSPIPQNISNTLQPMDALDGLK